MAALLEQNLQGARLHEAATMRVEFGPARPVAEDLPSETVVNEAYAAPVAQRERRERDMVRSVLQMSRLQLEQVVRELGLPLDGQTDEALREALFRHYRGVPPPSRLPL